MARLYCCLVVLAGIVLCYHAICHTSIDLWPVILLWSVFCLITELKPVPISASNYISVSFAIHLSALFIWGFPAATISTVIGSTLADLLLRRGANKVLFNAGQYAITLWLVGTVFPILRHSTGALNLEEDIIALLVSCLVYTVINSLLVAIIIALSQRQKLRCIWLEDLQFEAFHYIALTPLAILIALLYQEDPYYIILIAIPLFLTHIGFKTYNNLSWQARETIEILAEALDKRDPYTAHHSSCVAELATAIAQEMGLPPKVAEEIKMGGKVHDLGKIGIPDSILNKPGQLTPEEYDRIKKHPREGYELLSRLHFYRQVLGYVLYHHERIDGHGYPEGLSGEEIPLGARIISVADAYDAMTSNRPYRSAMSHEEAIAELRKQSGQQFDPKVVEALMKVFSSNGWQRKSLG